METNKTKTFSFIPQGVCARQLFIEVNEENNTIEMVRFVGGCSGNHLGINALIKGMTVEDAAKKLKGIGCGGRDTSCPDQLSQALEKINTSLYT